MSKGDKPEVSGGGCVEADCGEPRHQQMRRSMEERLLIAAVGACEAECACGWVGPQRTSWSRADRDYTDHEHRTGK